MRIAYSQKWTKEILDTRIKRLLKFIPIATPNVLLKVFCYTNSIHRNPDLYYRGHYRMVAYHGLRLSEIKRFKRIPRHIITIKIFPKISDEKLLYFLAHELGHYRDWRRYRGQRYKCAQKRCDKFAYKCIEKYNNIKEGS